MPRHIRDFFNKFLKLKNNHIFLQKVFIKIVHINTDIVLKENQIEFRDKIVFVNTTPIIKNELFIKQEKILNEFNKKTNQYFTGIH